MYVNETKRRTSHPSYSRNTQIILAPPAWQRWLMMAGWVLHCCWKTWYEFIWIYVCFSRGRSSFTQLQSDQPIATPRYWTMNVVNTPPGRVGLESLELSLHGPSEAHLWLLAKWGDGHESLNWHLGELGGRRWLDWDGLRSMVNLQALLHAHHFHWFGDIGTWLGGHEPWFQTPFWWPKSPESLELVLDQGWYLCSPLAMTFKKRGCCSSESTARQSFQSPILFWHPWCNPTKADSWLLYHTVSSHCLIGVPKWESFQDSTPNAPALSQYVHPWDELKRYPLFLPTIDLSGQLCQGSSIASQCTIKFAIIPLIPGIDTWDTSKTNPHVRPDVKKSGGPCAPSDWPAWCGSSSCGGWWKWSETLGSHDRDGPTVYKYSRWFMMRT